jgi:geranylgeranyl transferase type-2 subunit beta
LRSARCACRRAFGRGLPPISSRGASDLYYTSFGLRTAALLGVTDTGLWGRAAQYAASLPRPRDVVDCYCLLQVRRLLDERGGCSCTRRDADAFERFLSFGGGRGVYDAFLAALCCQMLGRELPGAGDLAEHARRAACDAGTNQAAASVALLGMLGALDAGTAARATRYLASMQRSDGGFGANVGSPGADLLSTFTALVALGDLGALHLVRLAPAARFAAALQAPEGGFRGSAQDDAADVEYTYYGLGTLGLLAWVAVRDERNG